MLSPDDQHVPVSDADDDALRSLIDRGLLCIAPRVDGSDEPQYMLNPALCGPPQPAATRKPIP